MTPFERLSWTLLGTHQDEVYGPRQWADPKPGDALGPSMNAKLHSASLRFRI
jgi:hypothetical protein